MSADKSLPDKQKSGLVIVYTGEGKGKTSASIGLICRGLGVGWKVAFIQFIKTWQVSEDTFFERILSVYKDSLTVHKGGKGFYKAGGISAQGVDDSQHKAAANETFALALHCVSSGEYNLVVCDEINNAVHDKLLGIDKMIELLDARHPDTTLCLTGRDFPEELVERVDIMTNMTKLRHHFDDGFIANRGIDY